MWDDEPKAFPFLGVLKSFYVHIFFIALPLTPEKGKKRGRPPKQGKNDQTDAEVIVKKAKRTLDRFNGMSVEEVMAKKLPDVITYNLDILIVSVYWTV